MTLCIWQFEFYYIGLIAGPPGFFLESRKLVETLNPQRGSERKLAVTSRLALKKVFAASTSGSVSSRPTAFAFLTASLRATVSFRLHWRLSSHRTSSSSIRIPLTPRFLTWTTVESIACVDIPESLGRNAALPRVFRRTKYEKVSNCSRTHPRDDRGEGERRTIQ